LLQHRGITITVRFYCFTVYAAFAARWLFKSSRDRGASKKEEKRKREGEEGKKSEKKKNKTEEETRYG